MTFGQLLGAALNDAILTLKIGRCDYLEAFKPLLFL